MFTFEKTHTIFIMKTKFLSKFLILTLLASFFTSCNLLKEDEEPQFEDEYLVSYELVKSYLPVFIETLFDQFVDDYPEIETIKDKVKNGVLIYRIDYNTTFNGENKIASGLVCIPMGEGPFPTISYQNGTNTLLSDAPSVNPDREFYVLLEFVASTGFIISIPDYLGFGASDNMFHPYLHKESTVSTVLDMLRAVKEMNDHYLEVSQNDDLYLMGYSQGGWATMQVQKAIEEQHSGEFNLLASAPAAGPYDLNYINDYIVEQTNYPNPFYVGYLYNSYMKMDLIDVEPSEIFQEPYADKIPDLYNGAKTGDEINDELTTNVADLFTADYLANYKTDSKYSSVTSALEENSVEPWHTTTPTMLLHGTADNYIPIEVSANMYQSLLAAGADENDVTMVPLPGKDHIGGIVPAGLLSVQWFINLTEQ